MGHSSVIVLCLVVLLVLAGCSSAPGGIDEPTATLTPEPEGDGPSTDDMFEVHSTKLTAALRRTD